MDMREHILRLVLFRQSPPGEAGQPAEITIAGPAGIFPAFPDIYLYFVLHRCYPAGNE